MNIITFITFVRSFTRGNVDDGSKPAFAPERVYICPDCGSEDVVENGRFDDAQRGLLLMCNECFEIGSAFEFVETTPVRSLVT